MYIFRLSFIVSFGIKELDLSIIGVHPHNANELLKWLQKSGFPDIMLGDLMLAYK